MNAATDAGADRMSMPPARIAGLYLAEVRSECLRYLRNPGFVLPVLLFPAVFYLMFGVALGAHNGADAPRYLLAAYATFGVMSPGLFGFGVSLATERENGLLELRRALPMSTLAYLLGKTVMAMGMAALVALLLMALATGLAHVPLTAAQAARLFATEVAGVVPFCALGLLLGSFAKGQAAPGIVNLVYLPMAFLSGLWFPLSALPEPLRWIAPAWPSYHLNQLALDAVGFPQGAPWPHLLALCAIAAAALWLAARRLRRAG